MVIVTSSEVVELNEVLCHTLNLAGVLDDEDAFGWIAFDHAIDDRVHQSRLAGSGAAGHQNVPVRLDGSRQGRLAAQQS
jgi:hypothetical protein